MPRVLLVEDNEMNRDMLSRRLRRSGWEVSIAEDGLKGIELARREIPDIILLDLSLPVVSGWEAARRIRALAELDSTAIIALSAHAMMEDRRSALAAGCDEFETKPVEYGRLLTRMYALSPRPEAGKARRPEDPPQLQWDAPSPDFRPRPEAAGKPIPQGEEAALLACSGNGETA